MTLVDKQQQAVEPTVEAVAFVIGKPQSSILDTESKVFATNVYDIIDIWADIESGEVLSFPASEPDAAASAFLDILEKSSK